MRVFLASEQRRFTVAATRTPARRPVATTAGGPRGDAGPIERFFGVRASGSSIGTEVRAGITTFFVMAYIIFVNPAILSFAGIPALEGQGPPFFAVVAATALVAGVMTLAMALSANYPLAIAPGMGLNAVVAFQLVAGAGLSWQAAMGVVFMEGVLITILVLTGFREAVVNAFPLTLKRAIGVGIGLFILFIGLYQGGFVRVPVALGESVTAPPPVPLALGNFTTLPFVMALLGLLITVALVARNVRGALLTGILTTTVIATIVHYATGAPVSSVPTAATLPAQAFALPDLSTLGAGINFEAFAFMGILAALLAVFSLMLSDFFDTMGTVMGIGAEAGWLDENGRLPRLNRVLVVDSLAAVVGGAAGTSSATTYIESAAGVSEGAKTGLASVVTALLFFAALFIAPVAGMIPPEATAPALIVVGFYMASVARGIDFGDVEIGLPALLTIVGMPLTYSITNGIGFGVLSFIAVKAARGKVRELHPMVWIVGLAFLLYFALPALQLGFGV
ncbi:MAG: NCS2 family permease [Chloroflexi bacterium]|nr:NCS2 family permease [Chloroflexota bacterium]